MPKLLNFRIRNFRGIQDASISIDEKTQSDVITLIGLNESGKTTVLEALSHFSTGDRSIPNLLAEGEQPDHLISLIPIELRSHFTGTIQISAEIIVSADELKGYVNDAQKKHSVDILISNKDKDYVIQVSKNFEYKDSKYVSQANIWNGLSYTLKGKRAQKYVPYDLNRLDHKVVWLSIINSIKSDFFELVYFPTFIVDMPSRVYL